MPIFTHLLLTSPLLSQLGTSIVPVALGGSWDGPHTNAPLFEQYQHPPSQGWGHCCRVPGSACLRDYPKRHQGKGQQVISTGASFLVSGACIPGDWGSRQSRHHTCPCVPSALECRLLSDAVTPTLHWLVPRKRCKQGSQRK